jgi:hypothetical protein
MERVEDGFRKSVARLTIAKSDELAPNWFAVLAHDRVAIAICLLLRGRGDPGTPAFTGHQLAVANDESGRQLKIEKCERCATCEQHHAQDLYFRFLRAGVVPNSPPRRGEV